MNRAALRQARMIRLASEEWRLPIDKIINLFKDGETGLWRNGPSYLAELYREEVSGRDRA